MGNLDANMIRAQYKEMMDEKAKGKGFVDAPKL